MNKNKKLLNVCAIKKKKNVCVYIDGCISSICCKSTEKNDVEATEHGCEIWINQGILEKKLNFSNISDKTRYYSDEFK